MKTLEEVGYPAFPVDTRDSNDEGIHYFGMTLRDYFAAKAMQGPFHRMFERTHSDPEGHMQKIALVSYAMADAMLKERNE